MLLLSGADVLLQQIKYETGLWQIVKVVAVFVERH